LKEEDRLSEQKISDVTNEMKLSDCGCCEGIKKVTPASIWNAPGLSSIKYRIGTHAQFKTSMLASISEQEALRNLTTREDNDFAIALLDLWATVGDVLTFYQERIANEGFLRTATERRSILELARTIGYELGPGKAADAFLAFSVDAAASGGETTIIPVEVKVQSLPGEGETPQTFETVEEIRAHSEWNELWPRIFLPQFVAHNTSVLYFKGRKTLLKPGDLLLVVEGKGSNAAWRFMKMVNSVKEDTELDQTIVNVSAVASTTGQRNDFVAAVFDTDFARTRVKYHDLPAELRLAVIDRGNLEQLSSYTWSKTDLNVFSMTYDVSLKDYYKILNRNAIELATYSMEDIRVYAFRVRAGIFGNSAPRRDTLPKGSEMAKAYDKDAGWTEENENPEPIDADQFQIIEGGWIFLDNNYPAIVPSSSDEDSWLLLQSSGEGNQGNVGAANYRAVRRIKNTRDEARSKFLITAKSTGLEIDEDDDIKDPSKFGRRRTTAFAKSELLEFNFIKNNSTLSGNSIVLDHAVENELAEGQLVSVTGEIVSPSGKSLKITMTEIVTIAKVELNGLYTKLIFAKEGLKNSYKIDTVKLNANVARAVHGETKEEILGSGNQAKPLQEFTLKGIPLSYVAASTSSGTASTLEVRVDGVLWSEVTSMYTLQPSDHAYLVRREDDGTTRVIFGDGTRGARLPSGTENIKAKYRIGLGAPGLVRQGQISLLVDRPLGVRGVTNPVATSGADNSENLDDARQNSTLRVSTMERIVSLKDVEKFALAFSGIGKALARWAWDGEKRIIRLTAAASITGDVIEDDSDLVDAINLYKDASIQVKIGPFIRKLFNLEASILLSDNRLSEDVFSDIRQALLDRFSFQSMNFNEPVTLSQLMSVIQGIKGVGAVRIDKLYTITNNAEAESNQGKINSVIPENIQRKDGELASSIWLLTLNPDGITLGVMTV
jgi:hypothetical protein